MNIKMRIYKFETLTRYGRGIYAQISWQESWINYIIFVDCVWILKGVWVGVDRTWSEGFMRKWNSKFETRGHEGKWQISSLQVLVL